MKVRIISGAVAVVILAIVMCFVKTPVFAVAVALMAAMAVYEVLKAVKVTHLELIIPCMIFALAFPLKVYVDSNIATGIFVLIILAVLIIQLIRFEKISFSETATAIFVMVTLSFAFGCLVFLRDGYGGISVGYRKNEGIYYIAIALLSAWMTDTCAYFTGFFLGRKKLCPKISPKKTVEGAIGGIVGCVVFNVIATVIYNITLTEEKYPVLIIIPISILLSVVGMCGDLSASVIKRNMGIKDYGKIMPGHGGIMDRFDSVVFTAPALYAVLLIINGVVNSRVVY